MLRRKIENFLRLWRIKKKKECLLIKGARQIGKTYSINRFGLENYKSYIYLNFIEHPEYAEIFAEDRSAESILKRISLFFENFRLIEKDTLIFIDEIQECPDARTAMKFLALDDRIDVIASGSLLGISYREVQSIPVGYERQHIMYSLDFEEYLWANGYSDDQIMTLKAYFDKEEKVPTAVHEKLMRHLRDYIVVGGMPAVVKMFLSENNYGVVHEEQEKILSSYMDDIYKYAPMSEKSKIKNCFLSMPRQLSKEYTKFQYSVIESKSTAKKYKSSLDWLVDANLAGYCYNVSLVSYPLTAYEKIDQFKIYVHDIGLLCAMFGFDIKRTVVDDSLKGFAKGGIYENLVACQLIRNGHHLRYFKADRSEQEIEFLLERDASVIPVEVKAKNGSSYSLNRILEDENITYGFKLISGNVGTVDKKRTMPLYMMIFL